MERQILILVFCSLFALYPYVKAQEGEIKDGFIFNPESE